VRPEPGTPATVLETFPLTETTASHPLRVRSRDRDGNVYGASVMVFSPACQGSLGQGRRARRIPVAHAHHSCSRGDAEHQELTRRCGERGGSEGAEGCVFRGLRAAETAKRIQGS